MPTRNIKSYIAVVAAAAALGLGAVAPAAATLGFGAAVPVAAVGLGRLGQSADRASGEGVLRALPTVSGGEVFGDF
jgi:hypothetical protein